MNAGCRVALALFLLSCTWLSSGCRHNQVQKDLLEAELRKKEEMYRELLESCSSAEARSEALSAEVAALRKGAKVTPEEAARTFGLKKITLGRGTGGIDDDKVPGDEGFMIVIEPRDYEDHVIKSQGTLEVTAQEINPEGIKTTIGTWTLGAEELRKLFKQSLFSTGYQVILNWKMPPKYENVRLIAKFTTPDGRSFEADRDIKVRLTAGAAERRREMSESPEFRPAPCPPDGKTHPSGILQSSYKEPATAAPPYLSPWRPASLDGSVTFGKPVIATPIALPPE
jgi:DNA-binding transcriptional regulator YiaG